MEYPPEMKLLFTHSYFLSFDKKQWRAGQPYPPLATLFAAAYMRQNGYDVQLHDTMFSEAADEIISPLKTFKPDVVVVYDDGFNYLTKMCLTNMRDAAFAMIAMAKKQGCKVVVSSSDATDHAAEYLAKGADVIIIGEGEESLLEVVNAIRDNNEKLSDIKGISFIENGLVKTEKRNVLRELDTLPSPAWELLNIAPYKKMWQQKNGYFSINMVTTRGCPYKCNWCAKPIYGNRYNSHSPQRIVSEIKTLKKLFNPGHIWFADDIFGLKPGWVKEFSELMHAEGLKIPFKMQSRVDLLVKENTVAELANAGCKTVWVGAESGSQKILDAMDKGTETGQIKEATLLMKKYGIQPCFFLQFGYPGENYNDILSTLQMVDELKPYDIGISVSYPLPGTVFYENVKADLQSKSNWTDSDELALMFRGTYSPRFYKSLHRFVHRRFRMQQALTQLSKPTLNRKAISAAYHFPLMMWNKVRMILEKKA